LIRRAKPSITVVKKEENGWYRYIPHIIQLKSNKAPAAKIINLFLKKRLI
jgi:hypothetical protein